MSDWFEGKHLEGQMLYSIKLIDDGDSMELVTDKGTMLVGTEGDCCAVAWIETINESASLPAMITGWEHRDSQSREEEYGQLDFDFYVIKTTTGFIDIEMRCSHNGYYSGWLTWLGFK